MGFDLRGVAGARVSGVGGLGCLLFFFGFLLVFRILALTWYTRKPYFARYKVSDLAQDFWDQPCKL